MQKAGAALATAVRADFRELSGQVEGLGLLVLAGKGHNGGDALIAATGLLKSGSAGSVSVVLTASESELKPLTQRALEDLRAAGDRVEVFAWPQAKEALAQAAFDIVIDGLVGMQFSPPLREDAQAVVDWVAEMGTRIRLRAAVDVPSGVGDESAERPFAADFTYATGSPKEPLFSGANADAVGRVRYLDIGFFGAPDAVAEFGSQSRCLDAGALAPLRRLRSPATHKRNFGHLVIVAGSREMPGAAIMCAKGALQAGVGLVTVAIHGHVSTRIASAVPEAMWLPLPVKSDGHLDGDAAFRILREYIGKTSGFLIGPGLERTRDELALIGRLVRTIEEPMVLDATALDPVILQTVAGRSKAHGKVVATPHAGEFARMTGKESFTYDETEFRSIAERFRMTILLKGSLTRISNGGDVYHSPYGGPVLARGGTGDILAGMVGALCARPDADALESTCTAAVWHGMAADHMAREHGQIGVHTTQLLDHLAPVLRGV